ncbi:hypothetical protein A9Q84_07760 [Halobacteriovorax marinus]|uniref:Secreted protein n=1 Tax=Halobacteriovorax marinus TaxID=97084 RepID=A0A1Y5F693_9BACT|nr:hypothetical protein A9Q84_07760 [Halobacteriovorax marinus]
MKGLVLVILSLFTLTFSALASDGEVIRLSGKFVIKKNTKMSRKFGTKYFFQIKDESGKTFAYPVIVKAQKLRSLIAKNSRGLFTIAATPSQKRVQVGEVASFVHVLVVSEARTFSLKSLGVIPKNKMNQVEPTIPYYHRKEPNRSPTFQITDKAANSIIFAAGAAILGSMLVN